MSREARQPRDRRTDPADDIVRAIMNRPGMREAVAEDTIRNRERILALEFGCYRTLPAPDYDQFEPTD
jgi:hypothetical protein